MRIHRWIRRTGVPCLAALALLGAAGAQAGTSGAYFTTYVTAQGGYPLEMGTTTQLHEDYDNWEKYVSMANTGSQPCFVRVKAFAGSQFTLNYINDSGLWSEGEDGYWYYQEVLQPGQSTGNEQDKADPRNLRIGIQFDHAAVDSSFNVVVIQEWTPVLYDADGNPYADWNLKVEREADEG